MNLVAVIRQLKQERKQAAQTLQGLDEALAALNGGSSLKVSSGRKRKMSAAGKASIAAAQRARWAKVRAAKNKQIVSRKRETPKKEAAPAAPETKSAVA